MDMSSPPLQLRILLESNPLVEGWRVEAASDSPQRPHAPSLPILTMLFQQRLEFLFVYYLLYLK